MKSTPISLTIAGFALVLVFVPLLQAASVSGSNFGNVNIPDGSPSAWVSSQVTISSAPAGATVTSIDVYVRCISQNIPCHLNDGGWCTPTRVVTEHVTVNACLHLIWGSSRSCPYLWSSETVE